MEIQKQVVAPNASTAKRLAQALVAIEVSGAKPTKARKAGVTGEQRKTIAQRPDLQPWNVTVEVQNGAGRQHLGSSPKPAPSPSEGATCACGCGGTPKKPGSRYLPGHDARHRSQLAKAAH